MSTNDNSSAAGVDAETAAPTQPAQLTPIARQLEKSRQSLLDLSTRNRLLSLPQAATAKLLQVAQTRGASLGKDSAEIFMDMEKARRWLRRAG